MSLAFKVIGTIGLASYAVAYLCARRRHISYRRLGARELHSVIVVRLGKVQISLGARPFLQWRSDPSPPTVQLRAPAAA